MKIKSFIYMMTSAVILLAGCGGGGASSGTPQPQVPTAAVVTLSTTGTVPSGDAIGGIDVTLNLPPGVTVKATQNPPIPDTGVVVPQGTAANASSGTSFLTTYTPGAPGKVRIQLISSNGIAPNEAFALVNCDIASGSSPVPTDFTITPNTGVSPTGVIDVINNGAALPTVTINYSAVIK